ncbi:winged helix-turn-helix transcriptional regulator [Dyadobacter fermentans]|uniref:winged helix-turn-helix transcriptional regulator n=1 Tax=Dyadobacter fermentans TaxID=94254 RepID=UPI001CBC57C2|nr:winged helix-turn-helix transcriptional regulator [Dyadobacter fermentans]
MTTVDLSSIGAESHRFREIQRSIPRPKYEVLAKELKDLGKNGLIKRTVDDGYPVLITGTTLPYAETLGSVIEALENWGVQHREHIMGTIP